MKVKINLCIPFQIAILPFSTGFARVIYKVYILGFLNTFWLLLLNKLYLIRFSETGFSFRGNKNKDS